MCVWRHHERVCAKIWLKCRFIYGANVQRERETMTTKRETLTTVWIFYYAYLSVITSAKYQAYTVRIPYAHIDLYIRYSSSYYILSIYGGIKLYI